MTQRKRGLFHLTLPDHNPLLKKVRTGFKGRDLKAEVFVIPCRINSNQGILAQSKKCRRKTVGTWKIAHLLPNKKRKQGKNLVTGSQDNFWISYCVCVQTHTYIK